MPRRTGLDMQVLRVIQRADQLASDVQAMKLAHGVAAVQVEEAAKTIEAQAKEIERLKADRPTRRQKKPVQPPSP